MAQATGSERVTIGRRVPGIFKFQALLSLGLSIWVFYPLPQTRVELFNATAFVVTMAALLGLMFGLYFDGRVSYTSDGFYIRPLGWRPLVGLAKEHFVAFDDIVKITPEFPRGGYGTQDWLMFGILRIHTKTPRPDEEELALYQAFLSREQLVGILQSLVDARPDIIDEQIINELSATA